MKRIFFSAMTGVFLAIFISPLSAAAWDAKWTLPLPYNVDQGSWWTGVNIQSMEDGSHFTIMFYQGAALYATKSDWSPAGGAWTGLVKDLIPEGSAYQDRSMIILESDHPFSVSQFIGNTNEKSAQGFGHQTFYAYPKMDSNAWPHKQDRSKAGTCITALPYTITSSGLYYLVSDLTSTGNGISVNADNVTIDLNGFSLIGPGKDSAVGTGIYMVSRKNVEVKNGIIREFGGNGIKDSHASLGWFRTARTHRFLSLRLIDNGGAGLTVNGSGHQIRNCTAADNGQSGIIVGEGSTVSGNTCSDNGFNGISAGFGTTIIGNTCYFNGGSGIIVSGKCTITSNTTIYNSKSGIDPDKYSLVNSNTAYHNNRSDGGYENIESCDTCRFSTNLAP